jgi:hypothetical protein
VTQRNVEVVIGRLATDEALRERFRQDPADELRRLEGEGLELAPVERQALLGLRPTALERFAETLDPRLQKATLHPRTPPRARKTR